MSRTLGCELGIVRELEGADAMRLKPVRAPDALDIGKAHARDPGHRAAGPVGRFARRFGESQSDNPLGHLRTERLDPRGPGLVAEQPFDALLGKPCLPAPDSRLALRCGAHDRHRAEPVGDGQHDPGTPDMLLRAVAVCHDGFEPTTFSSGDFNDDPGAHRTDSHARPPTGIHIRTPPSHSIH
jgi:hypothetical protein